MNIGNPPPAADPSEEINALIALLHRTEHRLEQLTASEVDAVMNQDGHTFVLGRAQEQLRHSNSARQAAILDALPAHIALLDAQGRIVSTNERWKKSGNPQVLHGPGYAVGLDYLKICDGARGSGAFEARQIAAGIQSVLNGERDEFSIEYPWSSAAQQNWFLMTVTPLAGDLPHGAVVMHLDVTARKQAAEDLRGAELKFRQMAESIRDVFFLFAADGKRIVYVSPAYEEIWGRSCVSLYANAESWIEAIHPNDLASTYDKYKQGLAAGQFVLEFRILRADGSIRFIETRGFPVRDHASNIVRIAGVAKDVTEHQRAEQKFEALLESTPDAIVIANRDGEMVLVNSQAVNLFAWSREEMLGRKIEMLVPERFADAHAASWADFLSQPEVRQTDRGLDLFGLRKDGAEFPVDIRLSLVDANGGSLVISAIRNITLRKDAERRIMYLNRVYAILSGINSLIVSARSCDELFQNACRIVVDEGGFCMALIGIIDRSTMAMVPAASAGVDEESMIAMKGLFSLTQSEPVGDSFAARAIRERRVLVSNDSQNDLDTLFGEKLADAGVRSLAIAPLLVSDQAVGVLVLYARERDSFHEEGTRLLTELAGNIASAIDNIGRQQKLDNLARVRALFSEINAAIVRIRDRDELLREACRIAVGAGGLRLAWAAVVDRGAMRLNPIACEGLDQEYLEHLPLSLDPVDEEHFGLAGCVVRDKRPAMIEDLRTDPRVLKPAQAAENNLRSLVSLPLMVSDTVVGVLQLYAKEVGFFDESEMRLLLELTGNISFALSSIGNSKKLAYVAYYDALTGLANRHLFLDRVAQHLHGARAGGHMLALFLVDLERFKNFNDSLGQAAGDALLVQVAKWLAQAAGDASLVARVGADHFALLLPEVREEDAAVRLLEKTMVAFLAQSFRINDAVFRIAAKVGATLFPVDGTDADTLLKNAEASLKRAKASGDSYLFFRQEMTEAVVGKLDLENQLRQALDKGEFELHYQPKVSFASGKLTSAEALIRWNDPRTGMVPPARFIPILEETGLIHEVGRWALRQAIADYLRWRAAGLAAVRVCVNVSPMQLRARSFMDEVAHATGVDEHAAAGLELEITESVIMADVKLSISCLQAIRALGVTIAIDDFGTGFSSLSYLAKLPVDTLKIDRSFIVEMTVSAEGLALVSTIINLAHSLKLTVVAEGVELEEQSRLLRLLNCDEMQGFLFSKPLPREIFEKRFLAPLPVA